MAARACARCQTAFRDTSDFDRCPVCGIPTFRAEGRTSSLLHDEIRQRYFDAYYDRREDEREQRGEPTPEQLGAMEARRLVELERAYEATA